MITVELTDEQREILAEVLEKCIADLDHEVLHTDHREFKDVLRHRRTVLCDTLNKLAQ